LLLSELAVTEGDGGREAFLAPVRPTVPANPVGVPGVLGGTPGRGRAPPRGLLHCPRRPGPGLAGVQERRGADGGTIGRPERCGHPSRPTINTRAGPETDAPDASDFARRSKG